VDKWRAVARDTAWKDYAQKTALSAELLKLAEGVNVSLAAKVPHHGSRPRQCRDRIRGGVQERGHRRLRALYGARQPRRYGDFIDRLGDRLLCPHVQCRVPLFLSFLNRLAG